MLNKEKGIYLKSSELEYVRNCLDVDDVLKEWVIEL